MATGPSGGVVVERDHDRPACGESGDAIGNRLVRVGRTEDSDGVVALPGGGVGVDESFTHIVRETGLSGIACAGAGDGRGRRF